MSIDPLTEGMSPLHYANLLSETLCEASRDERSLGLYLVGYMHEEGIAVKTFKTESDATVFRDTLPPIQQQQGIQPLYVTKRPLMR